MKMLKDIISDQLIHSVRLRYKGIDGSRNKQEVVREFRDEPSDIKTDSSILSVQFFGEINILNN